jgi:voltage-gated sodium channel
MPAAFCRRLVETSVFKSFIIAVIFVAAVLVGLETHPGWAARHGDLLRTLDQIVLGIFVVEILVKWGAELPRPWTYFRDPWNIFDFTIVAVCLLPLDSEFAAVLRLVRVLRVLRLVTALPKLQILVGALLKSIPSMGYVGLLLSILFYMYAVTGVFFFGKADPQHFGSLGDALLTLFGVITLEGWTGLMYDLLRGDSGVHPAKVIVYFVSFVLLGTMIMLNLFIGVIMNSMQEMHEEKALARLSAESTDAELEIMERELEALKMRVRSARTKL